MQQGDVLLFQTNDDGEIIVENGVVKLSGGLETAAYLSLFGGNEDDDGRDLNPFNWWGNIGVIDKAEQYHSKTQNLLQSIPAIPNNLIRIEDAAKNDLKWFIDKKVASSIEVLASIPGLNKIKLVIKITADGKESEFEFTENWKVGS